MTTTTMPETGGGVAGPTPAPAASPTRTEGAAITTTGLTKRYRSQLAVNHIDLHVPMGCVYGFLGPNGSGKTTTIRMLLGLITPTEGRRELLGRPIPRDASAVLPRVGALVEGPGFHPHLSGWANLARLDAADLTVDSSTARQRIGAALERVGLTAAAGKKFRAYSQGMRQRLGIAAALLRPRDLLILDEPTNGLDPQGTREVRVLVQALAAEGTTVLLSSHLLSEVEQICGHVGVMHTGRLVWQGELAQLRAQRTPRVSVQTVLPGAAAESLRRLGLTGVETDGEQASADLGEHQPEQVCSALVADGVPVRGFGVTQVDLEELFVSLTGEGFDVSG